MVEASDCAQACDDHCFALACHHRCVGSTSLLAITDELSVVVHKFVMVIAFHSRQLQAFYLVLLTWLEKCTQVSP